MIYVKTKREIDLIRASARIVSDVLELVGKEVRPGVTTKELDTLAEEYILSHQAVPAFKGYGRRENPFPAALCTSIDSEVVHGIPGDRALKEGEILSVDVGVQKDGYFGDAARSFPVGKVDRKKQHLLKVTEEALHKGIEQAKAGNHVEDISSAIQRHVESHGFSVVRDLVGHGVGKKLHEEPSVPNAGQRGKGEILKNGMTLAIEPMVNAGSWEVRFLPDGWTVVTLDGEPSAHFEHTIAIVNGKAEILSR
jgi:methionyl aminopeptidase